MGRYICSLIHSASIITVWPKVSGYLEQVVKMTEGRATMPQLLDRLINNYASLFVVFDTEDERIVAACVTRTEDYPGVKLLQVEMLGGDDFDGWADDLQAILTDWAKAHGCEGMELIGRGGWERKLARLGWKKKFTTMDLRFEQ